MVFIKKKNLYLSIFIILISFAITNFITFKNISKFDNYESFQDNKHPMIKSSVENSWRDANIIIENFKSGKNFFSSGRMNEDEFLPPKILSIFYIIYNDEMYLNDFIKTNN